MQKQNEEALISMSKRMFEACGKQVLSKSDESQLAVSSTSAQLVCNLHCPMQPDQGVYIRG